MKVPAGLKVELQLVGTVLARSLLAHLLARLGDAVSKPASSEVNPPPAG